MLVLLLIPATPVAARWKQGGEFPAGAFLLAIAVEVVLVVALIPVQYAIEGRTVVIRCGLIRWEYTTFSVDDILSIRPSRNPLSSPALSLDRLKVILASGNDLLISPKEKSGFLRAIEMLRPELRLQDGMLISGT